jgi:hypothetical protein
MSLWFSLSFCEVKGWEGTRYRARKKEIAFILKH